MAGLQSNSSNSAVDIQSSSNHLHSCKQTNDVKAKPKIPNPYERIGTILGTILALIVAGLILGGLIAIPGGLPVAMALLFGIIGCPKYIGSAIDCILEIKRGESSNNKKLATLFGCIAGLGVFIASICCPDVTILTTSINALLQVVNIPTWIKIPTLFMGLIGTAGAAADKFGLLIDGITSHTIVDLCRSIKNKIFSPSTKDNSDTKTDTKSNDVVPAKEKAAVQNLANRTSTHQSRECLKFNSYEKIASVFGIILALAIIGLVIGGLIAIPGGLPGAIGLFVALIGCPKYIGKAVDCLIEIKNGKSSTNQKVGTLFGCGVGFALGIVAIFCPLVSVITSSINSLTQSADLSFLEKVPTILLGLAGTVGAAADKLGLLMDCITSKTIVDGVKYLKRRIPIFKKHTNNSDAETEAKTAAIPSPQQSQTLPKFAPQPLPNPIASVATESPIPNLAFNKEKRLSKNPASFYYTKTDDVPQLSLDHPNYLDYQPIVIPTLV